MKFCINIILKIKRFLLILEELVSAIHLINMKHSSSSHKEMNVQVARLLDAIVTRTQSKEDIFISSLLCDISLKIL